MRVTYERKMSTTLGFFFWQSKKQLPIGKSIGNCGQFQVDLLKRYIFHEIYKFFALYCFPHFIRTLFLKQCQVHRKIEGKYRDFPYTAALIHAQTFTIINIPYQNGTLL